MMVNSAYRSADHERGDRHHERQVEQQLELCRAPVRFVHRTSGHPVPDRDPGARRAGFRFVARRHA